MKTPSSPARHRRRGTALAIVVWLPCMILPGPLARACEEVPEAEEAAEADAEGSDPAEDTTSPLAQFAMWQDDLDEDASPYYFYDAAIVHAWNESHGAGGVVHDLSIRFGLPEADCERYLNVRLAWLGCAHDALAMATREAQDALDIQESFLRRSLENAPDDRGRRDALLVFVATRAGWDVDSRSRERLATLLAEERSPSGTALRLTSAGLTGAEPGESTLLEAAFLLGSRDPDLIRELAMSQAHVPLQVALLHLAQRAGSGSNAEPLDSARDRPLDNARGGALDVARDGLPRAAPEAVEVLLDAGLTARALEEFEALTPEQRTALLEADPDRDPDPYFTRLGLRRKLALAYFAEGSPKPARALVAPLVRHEFPDAAILDDAIDPFPILAGLYENHVGSALDGAGATHRFLTKWLPQVGYTMVAAQSAYPGLIDALQGASNQPVNGNLRKGLPAEVLAEALDLERELDARLAQARLELAGLRAIYQGPAQILGKGLPDVLPASPLPARVQRSLHTIVRTPRLLSVVESPLAGGVSESPWDPAGEPRQTDAPDSLPSGVTPVRIERNGPAIDVVGSSGHGFGMWLYRSTDGGASWSSPLFTGLVFGGWAVLPDSYQPMTSSRGLRLEVQDDGPDAAETARGPGTFVEIPFDLMTRDSDADGLSDLLEERLLTDPFEADTDADGVPDLEDPLPQVPFAPAAPGDYSTVMSLFIEDACRSGTALGSRPDDTAGRLADRATRADTPSCLVAGDPERLRGLTATDRVIVLPPDVLSAARDKLGHDLTEIEIMLVFTDLARSRVFLQWRASGYGGTLIFTKDQEGWRARSGNHWISCGATVRRSDRQGLGEK